MKKNFTFLSYLVIAFALVFTSCKKDDDVSPEQEALNALNGTWTINSAATPDDANLALTGVTISFTSENSTYAVSGLSTFDDFNLNNSGVFEGSGDFSLNTTFTTINLNPGGTVNYVVSGNTLTLTYQSNFPKATDTPKTIVLTATK